jgi:periplasmic divalent cation tolerance protein
MTHKESAMGEILILTTTGSMELAEKIARSLVEEGNAACVNILPGIRSLYRWEGRICDDQEFLMLIKTGADRYKEVQECIHRLHNYNTPEVIALHITAGDPDYLNWLREQIRN